MRTACHIAILLLGVVVSTSCAGLNDGLVLYYDCNKDEGAVITDKSPSGYDGSVVGAIYDPNGYMGGALFFDTSAWIDVGDVLDLGVANPVMTLCAWIKTDNTDGEDVQIVFSKMITPNPYTGYHLAYSIQHNKRMASDLIAAFPQRAWTPGITQVPDGQWHFVCSIIRTTPSNLVSEIFVDGFREGIHTYDGSHASTENDMSLTIGRRDPGGTWQFQGLMDEIRIYNRALSSQEILELSDASAALCRVDFSNAADQPGDMTIFFPGEDLFVRICDVDLPPGASPVRTKIWQWVTSPTPKWKIRQTNMTLDPTTGCYRGMIDLAGYQPGFINVETLATGGKVGLLRRSQIELKPLP